MILLLDTSSGVTELVLVGDKHERHEFKWESGRKLSKDLLGFLRDSLEAQGSGFADLTGLGFFKGPGSFTGLRIGATVLNALANSLSIPIVGETSEDWIKKCLNKLETGVDDQIVLPFYGAEAHITQPKK